MFRILVVKEMGRLGSIILKTPFSYTLKQKKDANKFN